MISFTFAKLNWTFDEVFGKHVVPSQAGNDHRHVVKAKGSAALSPKSCGNFPGFRQKLW